MNDIFDFSSLQLSTTTISQFILGFIVTIILSLIVKIIYEKFSNSVSNKKIISNSFPLFSVAIFLIVITIKTSIVLSLGLVGALSIIRFRTAIKEAEQIVYFLILTAISISTAASSYIFPFFLVLFVYIYNYIGSSRKSNNVYSVNDQLVINVRKISNEKIKEIIMMLNNNDVNVEVQSINKQESNTVIAFKLSDFDLSYLSSVEQFLTKNKIEKIEIQFFSSSE
jgi:hypothetical protein